MKTNNPNTPEPIGFGYFGAIYDQFRGKVKEAFDFLVSNQSGDLLGVFHRDDLGDIDLVWGSDEKEQGLDHIIQKHINRLHDFSSLEEAATIIESVVNHGDVIKTQWDKVTIAKDGYKVVVRKNVRDNNGNLVEEKKNWVVTSFNDNKPKSQKKHLLPP